MVDRRTDKGFEGRRMFVDSFHITQPVLEHKYHETKQYKHLVNAKMSTKLMTTWLIDMGHRQPTNLREVY